MPNLIICRQGQKAHFIALRICAPPWLEPRRQFQRRRNFIHVFSGEECLSRANAFRFSVSFSENSVWSSFIATACAGHRSKFSPSAVLRKPDEKSESWVVDGEMHEIGENVLMRERFVIPRDNIPNRRRKQLIDQFMRRTRLVLKDSEHEPWCRRYMELYNELRETSEKLYWDDGYSKKLDQDHQNYDSSEDDDENFNPYRSRQPQREQLKDNRERVNLLRGRFEYERDKRMSERAFALMNERMHPDISNPISNREPFNVRKYLSESDDD